MILGWNFVAAACFVLSASTGFARAQQPFAAKQLPDRVPIRVIADLAYCKVGEKELQLDLAFPKEGKGPFPIIVCLHGGGWRSGSRKDLRSKTSMSDRGGFIEILASYGFAAATVSYRLAPDFKFPSQIEDVKTAVRFLRANAAKYNLDTHKVGVVGFSAGGHLALLLGLTDPKAGLEGKEYLDQSSAVQAVVDFFGPTDLAGYKDDETAVRSVFVPWLGADYKTDSKTWLKASPITYVRKDAPPILIIHGTKDSLVPIEQSRALVKKLQEVGAPIVRLHEMKDENHGWGGTKAVQTTRMTLEFFMETLKP